MTRRHILLLASFFAAICLVNPSPGAEPKHIYIANDDHTDFMWTADADTYANVFVDLLDFHLKLADETAKNPPPYRNRFNADGSYWLWNYQQKKSPAEFDKLMSRVKDGTIGVPLNTLVSCYGGQPAEAVLRGMYYAGRIERKYDVRFPLALAMENQTLPLGLTSLFAGSGAKYSWRGVCGCASKLPAKQLGDRPQEIYWYTGHDGQRLVMKWYSQNGEVGGYLEAGRPLGGIKHVDTNEGFRKRYVDPVTHQPYGIIGLFGFGGDDLERKTGVAPPPPIPGVPGLPKLISSPYCDHFHDIARQQTTADRQIIVSNEVDFFKDFEDHHGANLASQSVTYGNEWDLYSASMSETSARVKRAVEKLRGAEMLATLVSLKYPDFMRRHAVARENAFNDFGLYWEHDWTADGPIARGQRAAWQEMVASTIEYYVNSIYAEASIRLGGMISRPDKANRFYVLNPLGWARTDFADFLYAGPANIHIRDVTSGQDVPHQVVNLRGASYLRILAKDIPSAGYKTYEIMAGPGTAATDDAAKFDPDANSIENGAVKLVLDRDGAIRSFIDKRRGGVELAAKVGGAWLNDFAPNADAGDAIVIENRGPVSVTLRARSDAGLAHSTAITLYRDSDRVDIQNEITANFSNVRYWAFGFAIEQPSVHTEEVGAINLNKRKAEGGDYADTHARYDHITVNHFADMTSGDGKKGMTLSNPDLAFARLGNSTVASLDTATPQINLLAGGQVDGRSLGIHDQNGASYFLQRFALRAHGEYDSAAAMKFALEHQNPLVTGAIISKASVVTPQPATALGEYPADSYSLLSVSNPNVLLWALKPAEEGIDQGVIARFWNLADATSEGLVSFTPKMSLGIRTTHIETDLEAVPLTAEKTMPVKFTRQQLQTYRIRPRQPRAD